MPKDSKSLPPTSEGDQSTIQTNYKLPPIHPSLYLSITTKSSQLPPSSQPTSLIKPTKQSSPYDIDIVDPTKFNNFLKEYVKKKIIR